MKNKSDLPTEFRGCTWNDGWEFEAPLVVYYPKEYQSFDSVGSVYEAESVVEQICIDISLDFKHRDGGLQDECNWRGWSINRFARRKNAKHFIIKGEWVEHPKCGLLWSQTSMTVTDGPPIL